MEMKLETLLCEGIIDYHQIVSLYYNNDLVWKGFSENLETVGKYFTFKNFNKTITEDFNKSAFIINVDLTEAFNALSETSEIKRVYKNSLMRKKLKESLDPLEENSSMKKAHRRVQGAMDPDLTQDQRDEYATKLAKQVNGRVAAINFAQGLANRNHDQYSAGIDAKNEGRDTKNKGATTADVTVGMAKVATDSKLAKHMKQDEKKSAAVNCSEEFAVTLKTILEESGLETTNENINILYEYIKSLDK